MSNYKYTGIDEANEILKSINCRMAISKIHGYYDVIENDFEEAVKEIEETLIRDCDVENFIDEEPETALAKSMNEVADLNPLMINAIWKKDENGILTAQFSIVTLMCIWTTKKHIKDFTKKLNAYGNLILKLNDLKIQAIEENQES